MNKKIHWVIILVLLSIVAILAYFNAFGLEKTITIEPVKSTLYKIPGENPNVEDSYGQINKPAAKETKGFDLSKVKEFTIIEDEFPELYPSCPESLTIGTIECTHREVDDTVIITFKNVGSAEVKGFFYYIESKDRSKFGFDYAAVLLYPSEPVHMFVNLNIWKDLDPIKQITFHPATIIDGRLVSCYNQKNTVTLEECNLDDKGQRAAGGEKG